MSKRFGDEEEAMFEMITGARPREPETAPRDLLELMRRCWAHDVGARPTFAQIKAHLSDSTHPLPLSPSSSADYGSERESERAAWTGVSTIAEVTQEVPRPPTLMTVLVPPGGQPGMVMQVQAPTGQTLQVQIPPGAAAGAQFQVALPQQA